MFTFLQRSFVEISKSAFMHNVSQIRTIIGSSATLAPVIKANAYGHGIRHIAQWIDACDRIDFMCVANLSDALSLRTINITKPILVIGSIDTHPIEALEKNIHFFLYSLEQAHTLHTIASAQQAAFPVHIKIDTGLSRLGFSYTNAFSDIAQIRTLHGIHIAGIYSHLAEAQAQDPSFSHIQIKRFQTIVAQCKDNAIEPRYIHISNSAATLRFDIPECNFFRIGAALYGLWPSEQTKKEVLQRFPDFSLEPTLTWKSSIMHIQKIETDSFVGYNRTHQVKRPTCIAIIPVGYQDGYDIQFSNKTYVIINNTAAPLLGRICMNHMMADITEIPGIRIGDEVTLLGHTSPIDAQSLAVLNGTHNVRELLTHINPEFPRIVIP